MEKTCFFLKIDALEIRKWEHSPGSLGLLRQWSMLRDLLGRACEPWGMRGRSSPPSPRLRLDQLESMLGQNAIAKTYYRSSGEMDFHLAPTVGFVHAKRCRSSSSKSKTKRLSPVRRFNLPQLDIAGCLHAVLSTTSQ